MPQQLHERDISPNTHVQIDRLIDRSLRPTGRVP